ncbi:MAG TPA: hypothetical protein VFS20_18220 [Longimicrobium sp.]|nr:hypothetical protein [Longimicrobium sp.]
MAPGNGCLEEPVVFPDGTSLPQIPYGAEAGYTRSALRAGIKSPPEDICGDCNVSAGQHHHPGCDIEECPKCHLRLIGCGCLDDQVPEDD